MRLSRPAEMPKKLPKLVELLISRTPEIYKPAVAHAIFRRWLRISGRRGSGILTTWARGARLMTLLLVGTGAGKSSVNRAHRFHYGGYQAEGC